MNRHSVSLLRFIKTLTGLVSTISPLAPGMLSTTHMLPTAAGHISHDPSYVPGLFYVPGTLAVALATLASAFVLLVTVGGANELMESRRRSSVVLRAIAWFSAGLFSAVIYMLGYNFVEFDKATFSATYATIRDLIVVAFYVFCFASITRGFALLGVKAYFDRR